MVHIYIYIASAVFYEQTGIEKGGCNYEGIITIFLTEIPANTSTNKRGNVRIT
jgi:hypothetical protein